ncbi:hypothetical protein GALMADRAFT_93497 [Galerina marginata CBS 339.88]|uniref:Cytochrome P450 n=1 Tax=Galerina marginata (strain CBS 339.88) TaxID=685588 RepID=A0A067TB49_GALM3|nr:hypothetical protein GALMADRAFT_93497 [Galerina marginata CBS 339.88]
MFNLSTFFWLVFLALMYVLYQRQRIRYPPGPKGLPFLGIAKDHPKTEYWRTYADWGRKYGNIGLISFHLLGRRIVVLNSTSVAEALLVRRSTIYSDRPFPPMGGQLMRREKNVFHISYNERFKIYRKLMHQGFNPIASQDYWGVAEREARVMVANIYKKPDKMVEYLRQNASAVTMKIAYGYTVTGEKDHFVEMAEETMRVGSFASAPGRWLVDSIPALLYLPEWFPGAGFKRKAKVWSQQMELQVREPFDYVKSQIAAGVAEGSFSSHLLQSSGEGLSEEEYEDHVQWSAGAIYAAGADTTVASVKAFYFAMMIFPEIQKRAQAEIDTLMERLGRLPTIQDRPSLPYLDAIMKEVLRWAPAVPISLFHCTAADDEYEGYFIPAKTTIIPNIWAMMHDPEQYPNPFEFNPNRFIKIKDTDTVQRDPRQIVFGFGRRVCAGQHVAEASMFIQMATTLATLNISKALDENSRVVEPDISFTTAIVSHIKPFQYAITPRPTNTISLVLQDIAAEA